MAANGLEVDDAEEYAEGVTKPEEPREELETLEALEKCIRAVLHLPAEKQWRVANAFQALYGRMNLSVRS